MEKSDHENQFKIIKLELDLKKANEELSFLKYESSEDENNIIKIKSDNFKLENENISLQQQLFTLNDIIRQNEELRNNSVNVQERYNRLNSKFEKLESGEGLEVTNQPINLEDSQPSFLNNLTQKGKKIASHT